MTWKLISDGPVTFPCVLYSRPDGCVAYCDVKGIISPSWTHWSPFTPPEPDKSECEKAWGEWFPGPDGGSNQGTFRAGWSAATERAAKIVETWPCAGSGTFRGSLAAKIREK